MFNPDRMTQNPQAQPPTSTAQKPAPPNRQTTKTQALPIFIRAAVTSKNRQSPHASPIKGRHSQTSIQCTGKQHP